MECWAEYLKSKKGFASIPKTHYSTIALTLHFVPSIPSFQVEGLGNFDRNVLFDSLTSY
jgi:hypothetical protein